MSKELKAPRQGNAKNDPRRCGCGKPHDGRNVQYQRKAAGRKLFSPRRGWQRKRLCSISAQRLSGHAAKGAEKKALDATQPKTHSSRLQFSEAERATPELQKAIKKSDKAADCLDAARAAIPKQTKIKKERVF